MTFFDQVYSKLFPTRKPTGKSLVHEPIVRNQSYLKAYNFWKHSIPRKDLVSAIGNSYRLKEQGYVGQPDVHLLDTRYSNGFAISYDDTLDKKELQFLFDWFAEKIEQLGYKRSASDILIAEKENYVESKEKHYLKPITNNETPVEQKYGNIHIEYILIDDRPSYLKLVANVYSDRMYQTPQKFENLAEYLLGL